MEGKNDQTYDGYIKALTDISRAITSDLYIEDLLKLIVMVTAKVTGVLNCFTAVPHDFSETEVNLLRAVANQSAVAIVNTELMVKTRVIQEELEARKKVEQAKEILMINRQMTGEAAHRWMQKRSMDSRKTLREVAEAILLSYEIFNKQ
jgi:hypothetical protein